MLVACVNIPYVSGEHRFEAAVANADMEYVNKKAEKFEPGTVRSYMWDEFSERLEDGDVFDAAEKAVLFDLDEDRVQDYVVDTLNSPQYDGPTAPAMEQFNLGADHTPVNAPSAEEELAGYILEGTLPWDNTTALNGARYYFIDLDTVQSYVEQADAATQQTDTSRSSFHRGVRLFDGVRTEDIQDNVELRLYPTEPRYNGSRV